MTGFQGRLGDHLSWRLLTDALQSGIVKNLSSSTRSDDLMSKGPSQAYDRELMTVQRTKQILISILEAILLPVVKK